MAKVPPDVEYQRVNGHSNCSPGHVALAGEKDVVKSKVPRSTNGVGGAVHRISPQSGLRGAEQAVLFGDKAVQQPAPFRDRSTKLIMRTVFSKLCPACGKYARQVERELARLEDNHPEDARTVRKVVHHMVQFIVETEQVSGNLDSFLKQEWAVDAGNMHMEFSRVAYGTFKESTNWGRVVMFVGFAVSFSMYLEQGTAVGSANSVMEWTCQVVEEDLGQFFISHHGWVSMYVLVWRSDKYS